MEDIGETSKGDDHKIIEDWLGCIFTIPCQNSQPNYDIELFFEFNTKSATTSHRFHFCRTDKDAIQGTSSSETNGWYMSPKGKFGRQQYIFITSSHQITFIFRVSF